MASHLIQTLYPEAALDRTTLLEGNHQRKLFTGEQSPLFISSLKHAGELICGHLACLIEPQPKDRLSRFIEEDERPFHIDNKDRYCEVAGKLSGQNDFDPFL